MDRRSKIFVAGADGLVGSALVRRLNKGNYENIITPGIEDIDLTCQHKVEEFFKAERPDYLFLAAAKVGGIHANNSYPAEFIYENIMIQSNVIHAAWKQGVKRLLFLGSSCIYPRLAPQPIKEEYLLTGLLEPTNEPYALAKISGIKMCESYNRQYGTKFIAVMPTNLYGPGDNFHPENSHVLPGLIRRFHQAKAESAPEVVVWGSGTPRREFLYVDDMADGCIFLMELPDTVIAEKLLQYPKPLFLNLGTGLDLTIGELAYMVKDAIGYSGEIRFDLTKPDGTPQKLLDVSKINALGWRAKTGLRNGIKETYQFFLENL
ncbi:MAG: GDP-L-fucose synthase [Desulfuromonadales bacterium]|nr:GDP-L-fucose synthase [Desulfuromonadales bacterium]